MASLQTLITACMAESATLAQQTQQRLPLWENWLQPITADHPTGDDPGYDDDFQRMREEVNKLSGADTALICQLAEKLLTAATKDIRIATYYAWARLHRDGEAGLADGLELLAALMQHFGTRLHPQRDRSRRGALEWLAGGKMLDSLSLYPEVNNADTRRIAGALLLIEELNAELSQESQPQLAPLYGALENRLQQSGGADAVVPQNAASTPFPSHLSPPELARIASGQELLAQARTLAAYLREQPGGWLAAHRLLKNIRHDTLNELPTQTTDGRTRFEQLKIDPRPQLKRLYLQQQWQPLLEAADDLLSRGACHLWLDLQWYIHQALLKQGRENEAAVIQNDLKGVLSRVRGLERLAFSDGTPFADEVTLSWIEQQVLATPLSFQEVPVGSVTVSEDNDILQLEPEALALADSEGPEAALAWLQQRPGITTARSRWLLRLLMARVAEQVGKNDLAQHLLAELDSHAATLTLTQWEPELFFEVKARRLKLLRMKAGRSEADKTRLQPEMASLLAGLIAIDPARAAVLCS